MPMTEIGTSRKSRLTRVTAADGNTYSGGGPRIGARGSHGRKTVDTASNTASSKPAATADATISGTPTDSGVNMSNEAARFRSPYMAAKIAPAHFDAGAAGLRIAGTSAPAPVHPARS